MRRKDRQIDDFNKIINIIAKCDVCRVGMADKDGVYIVPMNFGYAASGNDVIFYFHSAKQGRKIDALKNNPEVFVELDCMGKLIEGDDACGFGYEYASVMGRGTAEFVRSDDAKIEALNQIMQKYAPDKDFTYDPKIAERVEIIKITCKKLSAKANLK